MAPSSSRVTSPEQAISIAQRFLVSVRHPVKEVIRAELDFEGTWTVEIELPLEGKVAKVEIDSGTGKETRFRLFDIGEES